MKQLLILFVLLKTVAACAQDATASHNRPNAKSDNTKNLIPANSPGYEAKPVPKLPISQTTQNNKLDGPDSYNVTTIAGQNLAGNTDGKGPTALLSSPASIAVDTKGNLYVADATNNKIRKILPDGHVLTFAGNQTPGKKDGPADQACFYYPTGVAVDCKGNLYVADKGNHVIRKITPDGNVTTLAGSGVRSSTDGKGTKATFDKPMAVAVDTACNVYVADAANHKIRKITPDGNVTTLAGSGELGSQDGKGAVASFYNPSGIAVDVAGNVYVADHDNNRIRKITPNGVVTTIAGSDTAGNADGFSSQASFFNPSNIAIDTAGILYITDEVNHKIRRITPDGNVTTLAGSGLAGAADGSGTLASFNYPSGIAVDNSGNIYVADQLNCMIRKIVHVAK